MEKNFGRTIAPSYAVRSPNLSLTSLGEDGPPNKVVAPHSMVASRRNVRSSYQSFSNVYDMLFKTVSTMNQDGQSNVDIVDKMFLTFRIIVDLVTLYAFNDVRLGKEDFIGGKIANNV